MNLHEQKTSFVGWMRTHVLKGFLTYTQENHTEENLPLEQFLTSIASRIKKAAQLNDVHSFNKNRDLYKSYFITINRDIARLHFEELVEQYSEAKLGETSAQTMAVEELWQDKLYREYLDVVVKLISPVHGQELYLAGSHENAKGRHPYILPEEVKMLKKSFQDPWEYVRNRSPHNVKAINCI